MANGANMQKRNRREALQPVNSQRDCERATLKRAARRRRDARARLALESERGLLFDRNSIHRSRTKATTLHRQWLQSSAEGSPSMAWSSYRQQATDSRSGRTCQSSRVLNRACVLRRDRKFWPVTPTSRCLPSGRDDGTRNPTPRGREWHWQSVGEESGSRRAIRSGR